MGGSNCSLCGRLDFCGEGVAEIVPLQPGPARMSFFVSVQTLLRVLCVFCALGVTSGIAQQCYCTLHAL